MRHLHNDLRETHIVGRDTPEKIILPKVSPLLRELRIGLAGVSDAGRGFEMARLRPNYGHVIACYSGHGEVLVGGRWRTCGPGQAYLTPPDVPHAFHTVPGVRWGFAWVWWLPSETGDKPLIDCSEPVLVQHDPEYLRSAILGLYRESIGPAQATALDCWIELVAAYVTRVGREVGPGKGNEPRDLTTLWEKVDLDLARPWALKELAAEVNFSTEHLRRLCQHRFGHGPMGHVAHLRMRRAAMLLESTRQKIGAIASAVGYDNAFAFSTAFKRHLGKSPAEYRKSRARRRKLPEGAVHEREGKGKTPIKIG